MEHKKELEADKKRRAELKEKHEKEIAEKRRKTKEAQALAAQQRRM
jgi:hypothetical protein